MMARYLRLIAAKQSFELQATEVIELVEHELALQQDTEGISACIGLGCGVNTLIPFSVSLALLTHGHGVDEVWFVLRHWCDMDDCSGCLENLVDFLSCFLRAIVCQDQGPGLEEIPEQTKRKLHKTLSRMYFAGIVGLASREQVRPEFRQELADALERLRVAAPQSVQSKD